MATVNANIVSFGIGNIKTNKGNLNFTVCYLDAAFNLGDTVQILNDGDFYRNTPFPKPYGFFQGTDANGTPVYTPFTVSNKIIFRLNQENNRWYMYLYDLSGRLISTDPYNPTTIQNCGKTFNAVYVGTNGYTHCDFYCQMHYVSSTGAVEHEYIINTENSFGSYYDDKMYKQTFGSSGFYIPNDKYDRLGKMLLSVALIEKTDPYKPGGYSEPGGGNGDFDDSSDPIPIPNLPSISALDCGLISVYAPTENQLKDLANYMWSSGFDINVLKKLFANPIDCLLGMSIVPVAISSTAKHVFVGDLDTGIIMNCANQQFVEVDCGNLQLKEYWENYLDYDPYTKLELYLPYIGIHSINADDIMGQTVNVKYHIDILTGSCIAYLSSVTKNRVLYSFIGQCAISIPITGHDWTNVLNGALTIAGSIGAMAATSELSMPYAIALTTNAEKGAIQASKQNIEKSGSLSGSGGLMGVQYPFFIITRPRQCVPEDRNKLGGYPSMITETLGDLSGYTVIENIILDNILATENELNELIALLKGGVIF